MTHMRPLAMQQCKHHVVAKAHAGAKLIYRVADIIAQYQPITDVSV